MTVSMSPIVNPTTGEQFCEVAETTPRQLDRIIDRAATAFDHWRRLDPIDRSSVLRSFADLVDENLEELATLEVRNSGHTITNARWEAGNVRDVFRYYAGSPERLIGKQIPVSGGIDLTFYEPIGIVGIIVPWNFPMPIAAWGMAPALAAGNVVIVKPAELTPLTALRLAELANDAGFPEGVVQVVPGKGSIIGEHLAAHPAVRKICFTGSTSVGRQIMASAAAHVKRLTLELGGKSANIIFADADLAKAAATAPLAVFDNSGQDCCARSRILVQENAFDDFMNLLEKAVKDINVTDPMDNASQMGPLISQAHHDRVQSLIHDGDIVFSGSAPDGPGFWMAPAVSLPASTQDPIWRREVFGPVASVMTFRDEGDAIALANDSPFGLSGSVFTTDVGRALRVCRAVQSGTLSVNSHSSVRYWTPFGGFKESGLGRELGPDAPASFCEEKNVFIAND